MLEEYRRKYGVPAVPLNGSLPPNAPAPVIDARVFSSDRDTVLIGLAGAIYAKHDGFVDQRPGTLQCL